MATQTDVLISPEEYLERERAEPFQKNEYRDGEIVPMSGASYVHGLIITNIVRVLSNQLLDGDGTVTSTDLRVWSGEAELFTYPDVVVVCGAPQFTDAHQDTLLNPALLIEVLSPSTEDYDRGGKFARYRTLESLREYVLVVQDEAHVEHYARQPEDRWLLSEVRGRDESLDLASIECHLALSDVYRNVELAA